MPENSREKTGVKLRKETNKNLKELRKIAKNRANKKTKNFVKLQKYLENQKKNPRNKFEKFNTNFF